MNATTKARRQKKPASKYHKKNVGASVPLVQEWHGLELLRNCLGQEPRGDSRPRLSGRA